MIGKNGYLIRDARKVVANVGSFAIEEAVGYMTTDIGGVMYPSFYGCHPQHIVGLRSCGIPFGAARAMYLDTLPDMERVHESLAKIINYWQPMIATLPTVRVIGGRDATVYQDSNLVWDTGTDAPSGVVFMSQGTVMPPEILEELYFVSRTVLNRFADGEEHVVPRVTEGGKVTIPGAADRYITQPNQIVDQIIANLRSRLSGESFIDQVKGDTGALLYAYTRAAMYQEQFIQGMYDTDRYQSLIGMKLFIEALCDLRAVLTHAMTFQRAAGASMYEFVQAVEQLDWNLQAVEQLNALWEPYFTRTPFCQRIRVESNIGRWVLSVTPDYWRVTYGMTGDELGMPDPIAPVDLGPYEARMFLPTGISREHHNPGYYRSEGDPRGMGLALSLPVELGASSYDATLETIMDQLVPRQYMRAKRDAAGEVESVEGPFMTWDGEGDDGLMRDMLLMPIAARVLKNGGIIEGCGLYPQFNVNLIKTEGMGIESRDACFPMTVLDDGISYRPQITPYAVPFPWLAG